MIDLASGEALEAAAWKLQNLEDYEARLDRAVRRVDELARAHDKAALVIYEAALMKSGLPPEQVRRLVRGFEETFEDEEEELSIPRVSGIMIVEGDEWFFGDETLRTMTGRLLGQFQHRVAQYNYVSEREVLRRWADGYDTRLFIRRRIYETEPVVGVVTGFDLPLVQYLRVAAGGDTVVPSREVSRVLVSLGVLDEGADDYAVLAAAENLALRLELPAPIVGEILYDLGLEDPLEFLHPLSGAADADMEAESDEILAASNEYGTGGTDRESVRPSPEDRTERRAARREAERGEEPTRVQDPQAKESPGVREEEGGERATPAPPEKKPPESAPGTEYRGS